MPGASRPGRNRAAGKPVARARPASGRREAVVLAGDHERRSRDAATRKPRRSASRRIASPACSARGSGSPWLARLRAARATPRARARRRRVCSARKFAHRARGSPGRGRVAKSVEHVRRHAVAQSSRATKRGVVATSTSAAELARPRCGRVRAPPSRRATSRARRRLAERAPKRARASAGQVGDAIRPGTAAVAGQVDTCRRACCGRAGRARVPTCRRARPSRAAARGPDPDRDLDVQRRSTGSLTPRRRQRARSAASASSSALDVGVASAPPRT